eukprot:529786_1
MELIEQEFADAQPRSYHYTDITTAHCTLPPPPSYKGRKHLKLMMFLIFIVISLQFILFRTYFIGSTHTFEIPFVQPEFASPELTHAFRRDCNASFMPTQLLIQNKQFILICNETYHTSTSYFPNKKLLIPYFDPLIEKEIQELFQHVQFNSQSPSHLIKLPKWGIASTLKHASRMIGKHYANNISVIYGNLKWKFTDTTCSPGWSCFLSSLDNGHLHDGNFRIWSDYEERLLRSDEAPTCGLNGTYNISNGRCDCLPGYVLISSICRLYPDEFIAHNIDLDRQSNSYDEPGEHTLNAHNCIVRGKPPTYYEEYYGPLYYSSQILWFLFKTAPNKYVLDNYARQIHVDKHQSVAIHIRRGDACDRIVNEVFRQCYQLVDYLNVARRMYDKYKTFDGQIFMIYIATDDASVIKEIEGVRDDYKYFEFKYHKAINRSVFDAQYGYWDDNPLLQDSLMVQELLMDIWTMKECDFFVGDFTSTIARLTYELMLHEKKYYPPYHSMYMQWCQTANPFIFQNQTVWC